MFKSAPNGTSVSNVEYVVYIAIFPGFFFNGLYTLLEQIDVLKDQDASVRISSEAGKEMKERREIHH